MRSAKELQRRAAANSLPLADDGNLDTERIALALEDATGIIVAQLPWLLKDGDVVETVPVGRQRTQCERLGFVSALTSFLCRKLAGKFGLISRHERIRFAYVILKMA